MLGNQTKLSTHQNAKLAAVVVGVASIMLRLRSENKNAFSVMNFGLTASVFAFAFTICSHTRHSLESTSTLTHSYVQWVSFSEQKANRKTHSYPGTTCLLTCWCQCHCDNSVGCLPGCLSIYPSIWIVVYLTSWMISVQARRCLLAHALPKSNSLWASVLQETSTSTSWTANRSTSTLCWLENGLNNL